MPVILEGPPLPGDALCPLGFCAVCAAAWKAAAFETLGPAAAQADKDPELSVIPLDGPDTRPRDPPAIAVTTALVLLPAPPGSPAAGQPVMAPLPVCWTHAHAVSFTGSGLLAAAPGPILLDGRNRPS